MNYYQKKVVKTSNFKANELRQAIEMTIDNYEYFITKWNEIPAADLSLHDLIEEELYKKFRLKVA